MWQELRRDPGAVYRGAALTMAREWADRPDNRADLTVLERSFLQASIKPEQTEQAVGGHHSDRTACPRLAGATDGAI